MAEAFSNGGVSFHYGYVICEFLAQELDCSSGTGIVGVGLPLAMEAQAPIKVEVEPLSSTLEALKAWFEKIMEVHGGPGQYLAKKYATMACRKQLCSTIKTMVPFLLLFVTFCYFLLLFVT